MKILYKTCIFTVLLLISFALVSNSTDSLMLSPTDSSISQEDSFTDNYNPYFNSTYDLYDNNQTTDPTTPQVGSSTPYSPTSSNSSASTNPISSLPESSLGLTNILNILLITVGTVLILLAIAIFIRLK